MTAAFVLDTARLHLRRFTDANLGDLVTLDSDPAVMRFISDGEPTPRQVYEDSLLWAGLWWTRAPWRATWRVSR